MAMSFIPNITIAEQPEAHREEKVIDRVISGAFQSAEEALVNGCQPKAVRSALMELTAREGQEKNISPEGLLRAQLAMQLATLVLARS